MNLAWHGWPEEPREGAGHRGLGRALLVLLVLAIGFAAIAAKGGV